MSDETDHRTADVVKVKAKPRARKSKTALLKLNKRSSQSSKSVYKKNKALESYDDGEVEEKKASLFKQASLSLVKRKSQLSGVSTVAQSGA